MKTLKCTGGYQSLAFGGNTIRKVKGNTTIPEPGETVRVVYYDEFGPDPETLIAEEFLIVSAIAISGIEEIVGEHWMNNHTLPEDERELRKSLRAFYGTPKTSDQYVAIYF